LAVGLRSSRNWGSSGCEWQAQRGGGYQRRVCAPTPAGKLGRPSRATGGATRVADIADAAGIYAALM